MTSTERAYEDFQNDREFEPSPKLIFCEHLGKEVYAMFAYVNKYQEPDESGTCGKCKITCKSIINKT